MTIKLSTRLQIVQFAVVGTLAVLVWGLFNVQVMRGGYYRRASEQNRIRLIRLEAPRGNIYDRSGILLAASRLSYDVYVIPEDFDLRDISTIGRLLGLSESKIHHRLSQARHASFTPVLLKEDVPKEIAMKIEELRPGLPGVFIQEGFIRSYPQGEMGAHIVGYIGKISPEEYKTRDPSIYHFGSWIGRTGLERIFDSHLRGEDGGRQLEVDARGMPIRLLGEMEPVPGKDLHLAIDTRLEAKIRPLLNGRDGAILVVDLHEGGLLAAVSAPGFDPNIFVTPGKASERMEIIGSKKRKLLDRSLSGLYPPGSIFKLLTSIAALETGVITPQTTFNCPGYFKFGPRSRAFKCWSQEGHGRVDLYTAIERSCNVYFFNVGRLLGEKRLSEYAKKLGFGSPAVLEVPTAGGLVPDAEWKKNVYHDRWYPGDTISLAIGQSYLLVSPLQILRLVALIGTEGKIFDPFLVQDDEFFKKKEPHFSIRPETFKVLQRGMLQVVQSDKGTGQLARVHFAKLAAKSGTAQAPPGDAHAWFGGFFPYENPEIAFVVFVERGKSGGITAGQIAKRVINIYHELHSPAVP